MLDPFVFDSRSESCKKPYGAVPCGTAVSYTVRPLRREGWSRCVLVTQREFSGQALFFIAVKKLLDSITIIEFIIISAR